MLVVLDVAGSGVLQGVLHLWKWAIAPVAVRLLLLRFTMFELRESRKNIVLIKN